MTSVENRYGEKVENAKIYTDESDKDKKAPHTTFGLCPGELQYGDRSTDFLCGDIADDHMIDTAQHGLCHPICVFD